MNGAVSVARVCALALLTACAAAQAQSEFRCDCTTVVDTCTANVAARGSFLEVKTDRPQCARDEVERQHVVARHERSVPRNAPHTGSAIDLDKIGRAHV